MRRILTIFFMTFVLLAISPLQAEENGKDLNPWVDCGIGAMLFTDTQWAAVTSNVIWDLGSTAVTSNSSSQNTCESTRAKTAMFIGTTYANLEEETVKGKGEHLHAMLNMMGCKAEAHSNIIGNLRVGFSAQLQDADYTKKSVLTKSEEYYGLVKSTIDNSYTSYCQII